MNRLSRLLLVAFLSAPLPVMAQTDTAPRTITCEDAIAIALGESYTVMSYLADLESMEHSFAYNQAQFKPRLDFSMFAPTLDEQVAPIQRADGLPVYNSTGVLRFGGDLRFTYTLPTGGNLSLASQLYRENVKTVLALKDFEELTDDQAQSSFTLSFTQPIFTDNTLRENLEESRYRYERSTSQFTRAQMDIIYRVTEGFYRFYQASRQVEIAREQLDNSEEAYRIAQLYRDAGRISENEVLIAEIAMSQNRAALLSYEGSLESEREDFKLLIGLDESESIEIMTDLTYEAFGIDMDRAVEHALENRLELREQELDIMIQEIQVDRAERVREFKGEISGYYDLTGVSTLGEGSTRELFDSSFDNFLDRPPNRGVSLTFSYPVFDWGRGRERVAQEEVLLRRDRLTLENTRRTIVKDVKDTVRRVREAADQLVIHERTQDVSQHSYEISRTQFENGDITSQELGVEQERLANAQLTYLGAFISYQLAVNDLKRKTLWDFQNNRSYLVDDSFQETGR